MTKYDAMQGILRSSGSRTLDKAADYIEELVSIIKMLTSGCDSCDFGKIQIDSISRKEEGYDFYVIDHNTGEEADIEQIALREEWADNLWYCDMQGFAILEDGRLILCDECGKYVFADENRFEVVWLNGSKGDQNDGKQAKEVLQR
jgi:hypothetical protein